MFGEQQPKLHVGNKSGGKIEEFSIWTRKSGENKKKGITVATIIMYFLFDL